MRDAIQEITLESRYYGYLRVSKQLRAQGWVVNHERVLRVMRADNLLALRKKRYVLTTDSHHPFAIYPNLVPRLVLNGMNQLWVADITYIRLFPVYRLEFASQTLAGNWAISRPRGRAEIDHKLHPAGVQREAIAFRFALCVAGAV